MTEGEAGEPAREQPITCKQCGNRYDFAQTYSCPVCGFYADHGRIFVLEDVEPFQASKRPASLTERLLRRLKP